MEADIEIRLDFVGGVDTLVKRRENIGLACHVNGVAAFPQQICKAQGDLQIDVLFFDDTALTAWILSAMAWIDDDFFHGMSGDGARTEDRIDDFLEVNKAEEDMALVRADGKREILVRRVDSCDAAVIGEDKP